MPKQSLSKEVIEESMKVAKANTRPGQTKEQTKIIAQGIAKGIAEYKKNEKAKARERDKERKKTAEKSQVQSQNNEVVSESVQTRTAKLPWVLLALSWVVFLIFTFVMM